MKATAVPLSFQQEHVWQGPSSAAHTIPAIVVRLTGPVDAGAVERALNLVVARHDSLRTRIDIRLGVPHQSVAPEIHVPLGTYDLGAFSTEAQHDRLQQLIAEANQPFDLENGPLIRAGIVRMAPSRHVLFFAMHHIIADLWSTKVLINDVSEAYASVIEERMPVFVPLALHYPDYAIWQREHFQGDALRHEVCYWRERLQGLASLHFNDDRSCAPETPDCRLDSGRLDDDLTASLHRLSRSLRCTTFSVLLAAFYVLARQRTGHSRFFVDSLVANRDRVEFEALIGIFAASLPLRAVVNESSTFADVVRDTQADCLASSAHQHLPFRKIQEFIQQDGGGVVTRPNVCFAFQAAPFHVPRFGGAMIGGFDAVSTFTPTWDQWWQVVRRGTETEIAIVYNAQRLAPADIQQLRSEYLAIIRAAVSGRGARVGDLRQAVS